MNRVPVPAKALLIGAYSAGIATAPSMAAAGVLAAPVVMIPMSWWLLLGANHWIVAFLAAAMLLPPLPIAIGNSGPHPALLLAFAGVGIGVVRAREWMLRFAALERAFVIFFCILLGSTASAAYLAGPVIAAGSLARVLLFGISVYLFFYVVHGPGRKAEMDERRAVGWLLGGATIAAAFACVDFYFQFPAPAGYGAQFVWLASGVYRRAQGLFYEASTLGNFSVFFLVLIAVSAAAPKVHRIVSRPVAALCAAVLFGAMVLSFSRGSIAALAASLTTLLLLQARGSRIRYGLLLLPLSLGAGAFALYWYLPAFGEIYLRRIAGSAEFFFSDTNLILSGRLESWRTVLATVGDNPVYLLFGIGYKTLPYINLAGRPLVADNMYLSLLIETGVAGVAAFLWLNFCLLRTAYRTVRHHDGMAALLGAWFFSFWVGELVQMLTGDLLTYWRVLPVYFWVLALAVRRSMQADAPPVG